MSSLLKHARRVLAARDDCTPQPGVDLCEKPITSTHIALAVVLSLGLFLLGTSILTLVWLHIRRQRRDARDDMTDPLELLDYGLEPPPVRKSRLPWKKHIRADMEASARLANVPSSSSSSSRRHKPTAMSMASNSKRESLQPLAASLQHQQNPFDDVEAHSADSASIRSARMDDYRPPSAAGLHRGR